MKRLRAIPRSRRHHGAWLVSVCMGAIGFVTVAATDAVAVDQRTSTVGMPARIDDLILPGSELTVRPLDNERDPVVVRIVKTMIHGDAHRYQIVYYGLEPGAFDVGDYLVRADGTSSGDLPEIIVEIRPTLPPGQVQPSELAPKASTRIGGYRLMLCVGSVVWVLGLLAILFVGRGRQRHQLGTDGHTVTLADRLRPIVEDAMQGRLTESQQAELERLLLTFWRHRLGLDNTKAADAVRTLRDHDQAGRLLRQLENWLHKPDHQREAVDINELLEPYRGIRDPDAVVP